MKVVGTICEYNPFHNGHLYSLKKIKEVAKPDILIVCLSTYFTMRGDLSLHLPKTKTMYALKEADIVVALPSVLTVNNASRFASSAVKELAKLKVSEIYCGSESNNIDYIKNIEFNDFAIKDKLNNNISYKKATASINDIAPNDLLAYVYYKAICDNDFNIDLKLIKREGDNHNNLKANDNRFTSSKAIRHDLSLMSKYSPNYVSPDILEYEKLFPYFKFVINNYNDYKNLAFISDGIEKHIINNVNKANSFKELEKLCTNSYFTTTKIKRAIFYLLFNINKGDFIYPYSKILGFNQKGKEYLNSIKKDIKIITNNKLNICQVLDYEIKIAKLLDIVYNKNILSEELTKPIILA